MSLGFERERVVARRVQRLEGPSGVASPLQQVSGLECDGRALEVVVERCLKSDERPKAELGLTLGVSGAEHLARESGVCLEVVVDLSQGAVDVVLKDVNLQVRANDFIGVIGPNGAGKTTTLLMLLGLTEPTSGSARVLGMDPAREPIKVKSVIGYLQENMGFYSDLNARQMLQRWRAFFCWKQITEICRQSSFLRYLYQ